MTLPQRVTDDLVRIAARARAEEVAALQVGEDADAVRDDLLLALGGLYEVLAAADPALSYSTGQIFGASGGGGTS